MHEASSIFLLALWLSPQQWWLFQSLGLSRYLSGLDNSMKQARKGEGMEEEVPAYWNHSQAQGQAGPHLLVPPNSLLSCSQMHINKFHLWYISSISELPHRKVTGKNISVHESRVHLYAPGPGWYCVENSLMLWLLNGQSALLGMAADIVIDKGEKRIHFLRHIWQSKSSFLQEKNVMNFSLFLVSHKSL